MSEHPDDTTSPEHEDADLTGDPFTEDETLPTVAPDDSNPPTGEETEAEPV